MSQPISLSLVGGTGLTGACTIRALLESRVPFSITSISRKPLPLTTSAPESKHASILQQQVVPDLFEAPSGPVAQRGGVYVSCLGTTRSAAGGVGNQRKLDVDLNIQLAEKAKADGADTMILVSSRGASSSSSLAYPKMKGELEDAVSAMAFRRCIILRPGFLMGYRASDNLGVKIGQNLFRGLRGVGLPMDNTMTDGTDVGQCIAYLAAGGSASVGSGTSGSRDGVEVIDSAGIVAIAKRWRQENLKPTL